MTYRKPQKDWFIHLQRQHTEWAKHVAWRAQGRLEVIIETLKFNQDNDAVIAQLETAIADVVEAIGDMRAGPREAEHYER